VYDLIESDNIEKLESFVDDEKAQKYDSKDFRKEFVTKLEFDLEILKEIKKTMGKSRYRSKTGTVYS
jgi:hypothetical protein